MNKTVRVCDIRKVIWRCEGVHDKQARGSMSSRNTKGTSQEKKKPPLLCLVIYKRVGTKKWAMEEKKKSKHKGKIAPTERGGGEENKRNWHKSISNPNVSATHNYRFFFFFELIWVSYRCARFTIV